MPCAARTHEHGPEAGNDRGERRRGGKNNDARQQDHLSRVAREQVAGRKAADSEAQSKNRREQSGIGEGKAERLADVGGQDRKQVAVRGHKHVGNQKDAVHRDGNAARVGRAFQSGWLSYCGLVLNCLILPFRREWTSCSLRFQDMVNWVAWDYALRAITGYFPE